MLTDGFGSEAFENKQAELYKECESDSRITKISVELVNTRDQNFCTVDKGHLRFKVNADQRSQAKRVEYVIPDDLDIIGIEGLIDSDGIQSLSLLLWSSSEETG